MKTIIDLQKAVGFPSDGIFQQSINGSTIEVLLNDYAEKIDNVLYTQYGNRQLFSQLEFYNALDVEKLDLIRVYILSDMLATEYKWEHLIKTTTIEYNPTENYNMTEKETVTDTKAENSDSTTTSVNGERKTTDINTKSVSPYNTEELTTESQQKADVTENAVTDTNTNNTTYTTNNSTSKELTRSGNIGVTTTQQMLESERRLADYSIVKLIAKEVATIISKGVYYDL